MLESRPEKMEGGGWSHGWNTSYFCGDRLRELGGLAWRGEGSRETLEPLLVPKGGLLGSWRGNSHKGMHWLDMGKWPGVGLV